MLDPPSRAYARHLLPFGYGFPLWTPEPGIHFQNRRDGLRIGDVGVVVPENGSFDVFFNICLPREHPFHRANGVPENFAHVELSDTDVAIYSPAENPGRIISTTSVTPLKATDPSDVVNHQKQLSYEFNLSSSEGALLVLPEGAESYTLLKRRIFQDAAIRNGVEWYNFAEQQLDRIIAHDSLYLITGCYKSRSWSVAAFHEASCPTGTTEFPATFKSIAAGPGGDNRCVQYTWETMRSFHWRAGPSGIWSEIPSQTPFISGFKIALRDSILSGRTRVVVEADPPPARSKPGRIFSGSSSGNSHSRTGNIWRRLVSDNGRNKESSEQAEVDSNSHSETWQADDMATSEPVMIEHIPEVLQSVHPLDIINQHLLRKDPSAAIAVTHDTQWSTLLEKGILEPEDLYDEGQLGSILSENYCSVSRDGAVYLQGKNDSSMRLMDMDDAACEAWKDDKLDDVEEILSQQIVRRVDDHGAYANRALVRARLHRWDAALKDAEISINIQPSVTGYVAKGFALFGQKEYSSAVSAFDIALRNCDVHDRVFVSLVKAIFLFEAGYYLEGIANITNLIGNCSDEVKLACSTVQADMRTRLATGRPAIDREGYEKARVHSLGPCYPMPELENISLICGWWFVTDHPATKANSPPLPQWTLMPPLGLSQQPTFSWSHPASVAGEHRDRNAPVRIPGMGSKVLPQANQLSKTSTDSENKLRDLRGKFGPFRILIIGRENAGKMTILRRICDSREAPEMYDSNGDKLDPSQVEGSRGRGRHAIENELVFQTNDNFVFHVSRGFEAGCEKEFQRMKEFIADRARTTVHKKRIHAIWYCIPMDRINRVIQRSEEMFFEECDRLNIPTVVLFTKFDALTPYALGKLPPANRQLPLPDRLVQAMLLAEEIFNGADLRRRLSKMKYPPESHVRLADMHKSSEGCRSLLEATAASLDRAALQTLLVSTQNNIADESLYT